MRRRQDAKGPFVLVWQLCGERRRVRNNPHHWGRASRSCRLRAYDTPSQDHARDIGSSPQCYTRHHSSSARPARPAARRSATCPMRAALCCLPKQSTIPHCHSRWPVSIFCAGRHCRAPLPGAKGKSHNAGTACCGLIAEQGGSEWTAVQAPAILPAKRMTYGDGVQTVGDAQSLVTTRNDIVAGFRWQAEEKARRANEFHAIALHFCASAGGFSPSQAS